MGDFRASIKVHFKMGEHTAEQEWWINWSPDDMYDGVDRRIVEWFAEQGATGTAHIRDAIYDGQWEDEQRRREAAEKAEYERLKEKFEPIT